MVEKVQYQHTSFFIERTSSLFSGGGKRFCPLILEPRNIYNANCVNNGRDDWNVFYGGWDGVDSCHDSVSVSVTEDSFATMNAHVPVISTGSTHNLNNPSATKTARQAPNPRPTLCGAHS